MPLPPVQLSIRELVLYQIDAIQLAEGSIPYDDLAISADDDIDAMVTASPLIRQNLPPQRPFSPGHTGHLTDATSWQANTLFVDTTCARIFDTQLHFDWRWRHRATDRNRFATASTRIFGLCTQT